MMNFKELNQQMQTADPAAASEAKARWDGIAKPLNGLGRFESEIIRIASLTGTADVRLDKRAVVVLCADNGVVEEGVTQTDASVTSIMAREIALGHSSVCRMAAAAGADVFSVDIGVKEKVEGPIPRSVAPGTMNIAKGPAMTREQALTAIETGIRLVKELKDRGYQILVTGEMGIGNTTTTAAVSSVLLNLPIETVTGRGAGLSDEGLLRKQSAIRRAVACNAPDPRDPLDVLIKLGGFDIAGMTGMYLGGALYRVPVVIDGVISAVSALIAARLCPASVPAMIASHVSKEPAAPMILEELGLHAMLHADLHLGEGTGGVCMLPLFDMALSVYHTSAGFDRVGVEQYTPQGESL